MMEYEFTLATSVTTVSLDHGKIENSHITPLYGLYLVQHLSVFIYLKQVLNSYRLRVWLVQIRCITPTYSNRNNKT